MVTSCGYSVQSKQEKVNQRYRIESIEEQFQEAKLMMEAEKDSMRTVMIDSRLELIRYKDSVAFMELTRVMCYQNDTHRHSCQEYK